MAFVTFSYRHLVILGLAATVACGGGRSGAVSPVPGPATPEAALEHAAVIVVGHADVEARKIIAARAGGCRIIDLVGYAEMRDLADVEYEGSCW